MKSYNLDRVHAARECVIAQIEERDQYFPEHRITSEPWATVVRMQRYVRTLAPEDLLDIRAHIDPFTGTLSANFYLGHASAKYDDTAYRFYGEGVPPSLWAYEPELPALAGKTYGPRVNGRLVTDLALLNQRYLCNLYRSGIANWVTSERGVVLEIGAGHGGFGQQFAERWPSTYIIVDLPETLLFSAVFLNVHLQDRRIYIYRPGDDLGRVAERPEEYDFILVPDYKLDQLNSLSRIHLAINHVSFPEMPLRALRDYLRFIRDRLDGFVVSVNYRIMADGESKVDAVLGEFFQYTPSLAQLGAALGLSEGVLNDHNCRPTLVCWSSERRREALVGAELRDVIAATNTLYCCRLGAEDVSLKAITPP